jgi:site-specific DNA recombinase
MPSERRVLRCAVYTRKSSEHGLEQDFNSLDAQREAGEAYIKSQSHEGWKLIRTPYADGGLSGATMERPALQRLLADIAARLIDVVVVYKVDRLTRSLADFAKLIESFEVHGVSFVSVTQQFNTTTSMGRLTLNVLLSFAQFEREVAGERIRDKFAASRRKGMWMGGNVPLGYDLKHRKLVVNEAEAKTVRLIFERYLDLGCVMALRTELERLGIRSKRRVTEAGRSGEVHPSAAGRSIICSRTGSIGARRSTRVDQERPARDPFAPPLDALGRELGHNGIPKLLRDDRLVLARMRGGLIFDDRGNRMSPTYTVRKQSRYRYYVSQAVLQGRPNEAGSLARIGAAEIEQIVVEGLRRAQPQDGQAANRSAIRITPPSQRRQPTARGASNSISARLTAAGSNSQGQVPSDHVGGFCDQQVRDLVDRAIERVVVHSGEVEITLRTPAGAGAAAHTEGGEGPRVLHLPLSDRRSKDHREIIIPGNNGSPSTRLDRSLVVAVARGRCWARGLRRGDCKDTAQIASKFDLSEPYVRRILRLAYLAPDVVLAIAEGRHPPTLVLQRLLRPIPLAWAEQRQTLGFTT